MYWLVVLGILALVGLAWHLYWKGVDHVEALGGDWYIVVLKDGERMKIHLDSVEMGTWTWADPNTKKEREEKVMTAYTTLEGGDEGSVASRLNDRSPGSAVGRFWQHEQQLKKLPPVPTETEVALRQAAEMVSQLSKPEAVSSKGKK